MILAAISAIRPCSSSYRIFLCGLLSLQGHQLGVLHVDFPEICHNFLSWWNTCWGRGEKSSSAKLHSSSRLELEVLFWYVIVEQLKNSGLLAEVTQRNDVPSSESLGVWLEMFLMYFDDLWNNGCDW